MPFCTRCKQKKPDIAFRLYKTDLHSRPLLFDVCLDCERAGVSRCTTCGSKIQQKSTNGVYMEYWCAGCDETYIIRKDQVERIKVSVTLRRFTYKIRNMAGKNIQSLRNTLFETIEQLRDGKIELDRAKQITETAKIIVDSVRVENEFLAIAGGEGSGFIPVVPKGLPSTEESKEQ